MVEYRSLSFLSLIASYQQETATLIEPKLRRKQECFLPELALISYQSIHFASAIYTVNKLLLLTTSILKYACRLCYAVKIPTQVCLLSWGPSEGQQTNSVYASSISQDIAYSASTMKKTCMASSSGAIHRANKQKMMLILH